MRAPKAKAAPSVQTRLQFVRAGSPRPEAHANDPSRTVLPLEPHSVQIHDLRGAADPPRLDREGFALIRHQSAVRDFGADGASACYLEEMDALIRALTGADTMIVAPGLVRRSQADAGQAAYGTAAGHARFIHTDYTDRSAVPVARAAAAHNGAADVPSGRVVALTMWRCLTPPPQDVPLALCDMRSIAGDDLVRADSYGAAASDIDPTEFYMLKHNDAQRWFYFSAMEPDELLVFRQHDSGAGRHAVSGCPHSAFTDPSCPPGATPRRSVEARAFLFL